MPTDTRHRRLRPLLACTIVFILGLLVFACTFEGDSAETGLLRADTESATPSETGADEEPRVRMFFLQTPWKTVLEKVAEETGATLVADRMPGGMFNRRDWKKHTRAEAIEVLNASLVTQKLRLVEKGDYIVLLDLKATRQRYERPDVPDDGLATQGNTAGRASSGTRAPRKYVRNFESVRPRDEVAEGRDFSGEEGSDIRRISGSSADVAKSILSQAIEMQSRRAVDVARLIYQAYKPTAKLIEKGPDGLPAFQAYRQATNKRTGSRRTQPRLLFTMGIDAEGDRLVVAETQERNRLLIELVEHVDRVPAYVDETVRLLVPRGDAEHLASQLEPTLSRLLAQRNAADPAANAQPPEQPQEPQPKGTTQEEAVKALIGGLKGNVSIEALQDLGIMILRGNEKDVAAVMQVIKAIEELTAGTIPEIHLLRLRHVDSTALAELLSGVYESLGSITGRTGNSTVTVIPVVKPNAVIILAPVGEMESILKLADELDQPVDPNTELEVFRLRNAIASQVQTTLESFYDDREGLGTRVVVIADVRTNSVLVHARPADLAEVSRLIRRLDRGDSNAVNRMKIYPLKNAVADELAEFLETALRAAYDPSVSTGQLTGGGAGGAQQLRDSKSIVLEFLSGEGSGKRLVRSGILSDIRVTANIRTNSLVVTAPEESQPLMEELIRQLDEPSSAVAEIKVFALENADASTTVSLLETLFPQEDQTGQVGVQVVGADDANSGLIPMRLSVDVRTNSIIAIGAADSLRVVEAILLKLDESDIRQRQTTVIKLKNSPATDVSNAINQFLTSQRDLAQVDPDLVSSVELLEREVIVVPEPVSNSLLLSATPRYYEEIIELVNRLDEAPAQVIIQALLVEVTLQDSDEFGIELGVQDSILFNRSSVSNIVQSPAVTTTAPNGVQTTSTSVLSQESTPGFNFNNVTLPLGANTAAGPGSLVGQAISSFALGRANGELGFGGLVLSAGSESLSVLIRALASQREVNILSRPQIRTLDNQLAQIQVGQQVPIVTGVNQTDNVATSNITQDDAGIILAVTPRISPDGMIVMEIAAEKSSFSGQGVPIFVDALTGNTIESPIKDITAISTTVSVPNGQTAVLGGMITKSEDKLERKVPWLGDLPYIGWPFRYDAVKTRRTELLIFLTPRIIRNSGDSEIIKQIEADRLHFLRSEAEEIHGPLFGVPEADPLPSTSDLQSGEPSRFRAGDTSFQPMLFNDRDVPTTPVGDDSFFQPPSSDVPREGKSRPDVLDLDGDEATSSNRSLRGRVTTPVTTQSADIQPVKFTRRRRSR